MKTVTNFYTSYGDINYIAGLTYLQDKNIFVYVDQIQQVLDFFKQKYGNYWFSEIQLPIELYIKDPKDNKKELKIIFQFMILRVFLGKI